MEILMSEKERIRQLEAENAALKGENIKLKAKLEYVAVCDYPELLEKEEGQTNE